MKTSKILKILGGDILFDDCCGVPWKNKTRLWAKKIGVKKLMGGSDEDTRRYVQDKTCSFLSCMHMNMIE